MAAFGFGGSSAKSNSQSSSYGYNASFSDSLSRALSQSDQRVAFEGNFAKLYQDAIGATDKADVGLFQGQLADLYNGGSRILDTLGVGAGEDYLSSRLTDNTARDAQLDVLEQRMGTLFNEELNPAITARHVAGGTLGGGRQGVAQGVAAGKVQREFAAGAADILGRDQAGKDAAASALMSGRTQAAGAGAQLIPGLAGLAQTGLNANLAPYAALSQILGGPTVLGSSSSSDIAAAISRSLGEDFSQSSSSSKSKSFNFGLG